jgi:phenylacetate-CoA ligase
MVGIKVAFRDLKRLYDEQRTISTAFGGSPTAMVERDAGFIAHECPAGNMHLTADDIVVEIINEVGQVNHWPGESW